MIEIKNLNLLEGAVSAENLKKLSDGGYLATRFTAIHFRIVDVDAIGKVLRIQATQKKPHSGIKIFDRPTIIDRTRKVFQPILSDWKIIVAPVVYTPIVDTVTPEWISDQLQKLGPDGLKKMSAETGVGLNTLTKWATGENEMANQIKAMFYYYFVAQGLVERFDLNPS